MIVADGLGQTGFDRPQPLHPLHQHLLDRIGHLRCNTCPDCPVTGLPVDPCVGFVRRSCVTPSGRRRRIRIGFADRRAREEYETDPDYYDAIALEDLMAIEASRTRAPTAGHHAATGTPRSYSRS